MIYGSTGTVPARSVSSSLSKWEVKVFVGQRASRAASNHEGFGECGERPLSWSLWSSSVSSVSASEGAAGLGAMGCISFGRC